MTDTAVVKDAFCKTRRVGGRLLIVDDDAGFRRIARMLLTGSEWTVVGETSDGEAAIGEARRLAPDLVLLDINLPGQDGVAVSHRLAEAAPPPAVVLVSSHDREDFGSRLSAAPVAGFVRKDELSVERLAEILGGE